MEFLPDITKWIQALLRWGHVFFAILWVGTSFTFNYLDNKLPKNLKDEDIEASGILQHSGYYYKLTRYHGAPNEVPKNVILWKYTSYLTFLSGVALLILIYYANADILMTSLGNAPFVCALYIVSFFPLLKRPFVAFLFLPAAFFKKAAV